MASSQRPSWRMGRRSQGQGVILCRIQPARHGRPVIVSGDDDGTVRTGPLTVALPAVTAWSPQAGRSVLPDVAGERDCRGPVPGGFPLSRTAGRGHPAVLVIFLAQLDAERRGPRGERGPAGTARLGVGPAGGLGAVVADRPLQHGQALAVPAL